MTPSAISLSSTAATSSSALFNVPRIPLALYIHIPWCVKKCPYCDFNSHELPKFSDSNMVEDYDKYVDILIADVILQKMFIHGRTITSIFIGGGTPSLLPIKQFKRLFAALRTILPLAADIEVTMEANPGTLEHAPFAEYLEVGINRLSIGVQTFDNKALTQLGRIHNATKAAAAIKQARRAGFDRVNVDLMHGLPNQTSKQAVADIKQAFDCGATHLSWYQLTIEPNTVFYRNTPILPDEEDLAGIETQGSELLETLGFTNYEVSAWVGEYDIACRHNLNYWQFGDYLAIGAGAHGKVSVQNINGIDDGVYRFNKSRLPKDYMTVSEADRNTYDNSDILSLSPKMVGWQRIDEVDLASEFMMNALRLHSGIDLTVFSERTGVCHTIIMPTINDLVQQGLVMLNANHLKPTPLGRRYINRVIQAFL